MTARSPVVAPPGLRALFDARDELFECRQSTIGGVVQVSCSQLEGAMIYVSMTGFRPKGLTQLPSFWWRTIKSFAQARRAPGNLLTTGRVLDGVYHTMTAWSDRSSMLDFVSGGAHLKAMKNFRVIGAGRVFGFACQEIPDWDVVYQLWKQHGREV